MAVHCDVCSTAIMNAGENDGSFQVDATFDGPTNSCRITNTCEACARVLRQAVAKAANAIVKNAKRAKHDNMRSARFAAAVKVLLMKPTTCPKISMGGDVIYCDDYTCLGQSDIKALSDLGFKWAADLHAFAFTYVGPL